jgi:predicted nucleic acid-binding protein
MEKAFKVLLDTNILIERENPKREDADVAGLFRCLDRIHAEKYIHPGTMTEIEKYGDEKERGIVLAKLGAYEQISNPPATPSDFLAKIEPYPSLVFENDKIDDALLFQVFDGRMDLLITQDRKMLEKAKKLQIKSKVLNVEDFLEFYYKEHPDLIQYKVLSIKVGTFSEIDLEDPFFDSFKKDYKGFSEWYKKKSNEQAYYCRSDEGKLLGFLYIKTEGESEDYSDMTAPFKPMKRLKVGTFKVLSSGFRLGERFIKIILDNAVRRGVDDVYVTMFEKRDELEALKTLFNTWGFSDYCEKRSTGEEVFVKNMRDYFQEKDPRFNYPLLEPNKTFMFLPIEQNFHTDLFPDSFLRNENLQDFIQNKPYRYAIQKIYISWAPTKSAAPGDVVLIYRKGTPGNARYTGVVSTICILDRIDVPKFEDDLLALCKNRSLFTLQELRDFWKRSGATRNLKVVRLLYYKTLNKKVTLGQLWDNNIVVSPNGPRSFDPVSCIDAANILKMSGTEL